MSSDHKSGKKSVSSTSEKKRDRSASPAPCPVSKKHEHASAPLADTSSGLESAHQSGATKGDKLKPISDHDKDTTGSLFWSTSVVSQPDQDPAHTFTGSGACAFPPATELDPYEQVSEDECSVTFSGSDEGQLSDSTETQTEDMSYRETV